MLEDLMDYESLTADIGQTLKDEAYDGFKRAYIVGIVLGGLEILSGLITTISTEMVGFFLLAPLVAFLQFLIIMAVARMRAIKLYAEGESVHLLQAQKNMMAVMHNAYGTPVMQSAPAAPAAPVYHQPLQTYNCSRPTYTAPQQAAPVANPEDNFWYCKNCGTKNKNDYGQCKKCATYRG